jgi:hypothetical protein
MTRQIVRGVSTVVVLAAAVVIAACGDDASTSPVRFDDVFWKVGVSPRGIIVAANGTQQINAVPLNKDGDTLTGPTQRSYSLADSTKVSIDSTGLLTGLAVTPALPVAVVTTMTMANITHVDTSWVMVTSQAYQPKSLTIAPLGGPSGYIYLTPKMIKATITDVNDDPIPVSYAYLSVPPKSVGYPYPNLQFVLGLLVGSVTVHGDVTAYGVALSDSTTLNFTPPPGGSLSFTVGVDGTLAEPNAGHRFSVTAPAVISLSNKATDTVRVAFTGPGVAGDTAAISPSGRASQILPEAGTYTWTVVSALGKGLSGTILAY